MSEQTDQHGRCAVITGASGGIGAALARQLKAAGATVVIVGRSATRTRDIGAELACPAHVVDFADLGQVRDLADVLLATCPRIDVLVNNAGLIAARRTETTDGHETTLQVNHLAPFLLTTLLRDRLAASQGRVITTASAAHASRRARVDLDDLDFRGRYSALDAYATTKLENVLFTRELARRWAILGICAAAAHPGMVASAFGRSSTLAVRVFMASPMRLLMRSPQRGADTLVWLSTSRPGTDWTSGGYYADRAPAHTHPQADDAELAGQLWNRSLELVGGTDA